MKQLPLFIISAILQVFLSAPALATTAVLIDNETLAVRSYLDVLSSDQKIPFEVATANENAHKYQPIPKGPVQGMHNWYRIKVRVADNSAGAYILTFPEIGFQEIDFHYLKNKLTSMEVSIGIR